MDHLGGLHVGPGAQVPPLVADVVDGDGLGFDGIQNLQLVRLANLLDVGTSSY